MRIVTFKVEEDLLVMLDKYALEHGLNRSEVIRRAIEKMVKEEITYELMQKAKAERGHL